MHRLWEKEISIRGGSPIHSFALRQSLACLGAEASAEVWSLADRGSRLAVLHLADVSLTYPSFYMKAMAMSDCLVVGMLSTGKLDIFTLFVEVWKPF